MENTPNHQLIFVFGPQYIHFLSKTFYGRKMLILFIKVVGNSYAQVSGIKSTTKKKRANYSVISNIIREIVQNHLTS